MDPDALIQRVSPSRRVVAITGGARGIGRSTAVALAATGASVAIGDLDAEATARTAEEVGPSCIGLTVDVRDKASFGDFLDWAEAQLGALDVLINNAGIMHLGRFSAQDASLSERMIDVNLRGVINGTRLALDRMLPRGRGHIVNMASSAGKVGLPHAAIYCATKHAVVGLSEALRAELRGTGVEISCVMPGLVRTELGSGVATRGVSAVEPEAVAAAIVSMLERPRFELYVPSVVGAISRCLPLAPRRVRDWALDATGANHAFRDADPAARAAYDGSRAASADRHRHEELRHAD
jgi:NADP-dependent 3-hydroxy acid dehydrogenase YdfG